ncbi:MAG TPA: TetR family transcriptional regulator [Acidimicrobiales bacterium]|nr:TetR family transcriptional regulator [Acidimicrobiales bacterium]
MPKREQPAGGDDQGLRSRKQARTRRELEHAALDLFETKGYEKTTVEEIAAVVEVSPRTFFRYFRSKEEVLFGQEQDHVAQLRQIVRDCPAAAIDTAALDEALLTFANYLSKAQDPLLVRAKLVAQNPRLAERSLRVLRSWELALSDELAVQAGMREPDLRLKVLAAAGLATMNVAVRVWQVSGGNESLVAIVKRALELGSSPVARVPRRSRSSAGSRKGLGGRR